MNNANVCTLYLSSSLGGGLPLHGKERIRQFIRLFEDTPELHARRYGPTHDDIARDTDRRHCFAPRLVVVFFLVSEHGKKAGAVL